MGRQQNATSWDIEEGGLVRALEFKHRLRVCNAFPSGLALHVFLSKDVRLTSDAPMPYKACRDFKSPLKASDNLEFRIGEVSSGTFSVTDLPNNDAVLLLVVHRHDTVSSAVAFKSHVFGSLPNAQAAIIDTYRGNATRTLLRIMDAVQGPVVSAAQVKSKSNATLHPEELHYNSVVAINPGIYEVELDDPSGKPEAKSQLVAVSHESYVVLRIGVEATEGQSYPQGLVIFPSSSPGSLLHSSAVRPTTIAVMVCLALLGTLM